MKVKVDPSLMSLSGRWTRKDNTVIARFFHFVRSLVAGTTPAVQVPGSTTTTTNPTQGGGISD